MISEQPDLAIPSRPVWILEQGYPEARPGRTARRDRAAGAEAAQTNTFSFGPLEPDETQRDRLAGDPRADRAPTPSTTGSPPGLQGKAVAVTDDGSVPEGEFVVQITAAPPQTRVDDAGKVVPIKKGDIIGQAGTDEQKSELGGGTSTSP